MVPENDVHIPTNKKYGKQITNDKMKKKKNTNLYKPPELYVNSSKRNEPPHGAPIQIPLATTKNKIDQNHFLIAVLKIKHLTQ